MTEQITILTSSVIPKDFLWLAITVTFATKVVRISNTCVQEVVVCFVVNQNARIVLVILRALNNQVGEQASSVKLAVLSSGHKIVWTTILKPDFALCNWKAHRAPVQYQVTPLQVTVAQRNGALLVRNTLTTHLRKFMSASCKGPEITWKMLLILMFPEARQKSPTSERKNPLLMTFVFCFLILRQSRVVTIGMNMFQFS